MTQAPLGWYFHPATMLDSAFVVGSPKGDLGHLGDLLPKRGLLKVTFLFKSLLSKRKDDRDVLHTSFAAHKAELFLR